MVNDENKISVKQFLLILVLLFCAPAIRYVPLYSSKAAQRAAWLSPFVALIFLLIYILVWNKFVEKYGSKSFIEIIKDILGKLLGSVVCIIYFVWITLFLSFNIRMYAERILGSAMPGVSIYLLIGSMLIVVWYVIRDGITPFARMTEIFFYTLGLIFIIYNILVIAKVDFSNMYPITYKDALPLIKGSAPIISIFGYNVIIFMFNDVVTHKGQFKKSAIRSLLIIIFISYEVIMIPISIFGADIVAKMPIPYLNTMMQISLFDIIERLESGIIMFWIISDFTLVAAFTYSAMHMIKTNFNLNDTKSLIPMYLIGIFFLSIILASSATELLAFSEKILTPTNITLGYMLPIVIYIIGKIRKKV